MGYLATAGRASNATLRRAMVYGSVMGSFAVERFGLDRLRALTRREVDARARHFQRLTQFRLYGEEDEATFSIRAKKNRGKE